MRHLIAVAVALASMLPHPHLHLHRQMPRGRLMRVWTTYYCLTGITASGLNAGPGIAASYVVPWGHRFRDLTDGWTGKVLDHPDAHTQLDEWLTCPRSFQTGYHTIEVW